MHDLMPDGRTGPFLRVRHYHDRAGTLTYDPRCRLCRSRFDAGEVDLGTAVEEMDKRDRRGEKVRAI